MKTFHTAVLASVLASSPAFAHHSPSAYDQTVAVVFKGTITKVGWMNPHIYFTLAVTGADGTTVEQEVQAGSISVNTASATSFPARRSRSAHTRTGVARGGLCGVST